MIVSYDKIKNLSVYELKNHSKLGEVAEIILKNEDFQIAGLILKKNVLSKEEHVISELDIIEISNKGVIVQNAEAVLESSELIRIKELIKEGYVGAGQRVVTRSGRYIGRVCNFLVDSSTLMVTKFYTKNLLSEKIFSTHNIVSFEGRTIIIRDDLESAKLKTAPSIETSPI